MPTKKRTVKKTVYEHSQDNIADLKPTDFMAPSRKGGRVPTPEEERIRQWHRDGLTVQRICENSGANPRTVYELLGLDQHTPEFKDLVAKLQDRKRM